MKGALGITNQGGAFGRGVRGLQIISPTAFLEG